MSKRRICGAEPDFVFIRVGWDEAQFGTIHGPEILTVLIPIQKTADGELRELTSGVYIPLIEWVGGVRIGLGIDGDGCLSSRLRASIEVREDIVAVIRLVLSR